MTVEKPKPKQLLRPITTGAGSARSAGKLRLYGAIGFCFDSQWLKNWRESFKPITKRSNLRPIITGANSAIIQSEFLAITCNLPKAREKSCAQGAIGFAFAFASHWLEKWRRFEANRYT